MIMTVIVLIAIATTVAGRKLDLAAVCSSLPSLGDSYLSSFSNGVLHTEPATLNLGLISMGLGTAESRKLLRNSRLCQ